MADPISISLFAATAAGLSGTTLAIATYAGAAAIIGGLSVGATLASSALMGGPQGIKPSDVQQEIKHPLAERTKSYGRVRKSGAVFFTDTDPNAPKELYIGMALNHGRISNIVEYMIDDTIVTIDGSGDVNEDPYNDELANITYRLGLPSETPYPLLTSKFGMANMRGDGVASILGAFGNSTDANAQMETYPSGIPQMRATMDTSVCFDPRNVGHDVADQSTWEFSDNAAVVVLNYLIDPDGFGLSYDRILPNLAEWIVAMNICDEDVTLRAGGTEKRYRGAGTYSLGERPRDVIARIIGAGDGRVWQRRDGSIGIRVGRYSEPTVTIKSRDILSYRVEVGQDPINAVVGLRAQYTSPDHDYREYEAQPWPTGEDIVGLDEDRVDTLDLLWSPSHGQTRRIMKREYKRRTASWRVQVSTNLAGLRALDEQFINIEIDELGIAESFEVTKFTLDPSTLTCQMELVSVDASIDDWDPSTEENGPIPVFEFFDSTTSNTVNFTWPGSVAEGYVAFAFDLGGSAGPAIPDNTPAGFAPLYEYDWTDFGFPSQVRVSYRVCDGTETGTFAGVNTTNIEKVLLVFRPTSGDVSVVNIGPTNQEYTTGNPSAQTVLSAAQEVPVISFGIAIAAGANFTGVSPAFDGTVARSGGAMMVGHKTFNTAPVDQTVDMNDLGSNTLISFPVSLS